MSLPVSFLPPRLEDLGSQTTPDHTWRESKEFSVVFVVFVTQLAKIPCGPVTTIRQLRLPSLFHNYAFAYSIIIFIYYI